MDNKVIGKYGEEIAQDYLKNNGFKILETNYRYSKIAEIDIIAYKNNTIHFIEVKTRRSAKYGSPQEAITKCKLESIQLCAKYYLTQTKIRYSKIQIDAIGILIDNNKYDISFIEGIEL